MKKEDLVGVWDDLGPYDVSCYTFIFYPTGNGLVEFFNWDWCFTYKFNWKIDENRLDLTNVKYIDYSNKNQHCPSAYIHFNLMTDGRLKIIDTNLESVSCEPLQRRHTDPQAYQPEV